MLRYFRADLSEFGRPVASTFGSFDTRIDLETSLATGDTKAFADLALPASHDQVILVTHPWFAPAFVTSVSSGLPASEIRKSIFGEVDQVLGSVAPWKIHFEYVGIRGVADTRVDRILVSCLPKPALSFQELIRTSRFDVRSSIGLIAEIMISREAQRAASNQTSVAVGIYDGHAELCVVEDGTLRCCGYVSFHVLEEVFEEIHSFIQSFGSRNRRPTNLLVYGHRLTDDNKLALETRLRTKTPAEPLRPVDLFETHGRSVTEDSRFGLTAAGTLSALLSSP